MVDGMAVNNTEADNAGRRLLIRCRLLIRRHLLLFKLPAWHVPFYFLFCPASALLPLPLPLLWVACTVLRSRVRPVLHCPLDVPTQTPAHVHGDKQAGRHDGVGAAGNHLLLFLCRQRPLHHLLSSRTSSGAAIASWADATHSTVYSLPNNIWPRLL